MQPRTFAGLVLASVVTAIALGVAVRGAPARHGVVEAWCAPLEDLHPEGPADFWACSRNRPVDPSFRAHAVRTDLVFIWSSSDPRVSAGELERSEGPS